MAHWSHYDCVWFKLQYLNQLSTTPNVLEYGNLLLSLSSRFSLNQKYVSWAVCHLDVILTDFFSQSMCDLFYLDIVKYKSLGAFKIWVFFQIYQHNFRLFSISLFKCIKKQLAAISYRIKLTCFLSFLFFWSITFLAFFRRFWYFWIHVLRSWLLFLRSTPLFLDF